MSDARSLTYVHAFTEAVRLEMEADPDVFIAGEDVGAHGGVFHTFDGIQNEFGERRAVDTPISEQAIIGLGIGAAVTGLRPIVDLMFMDFVLVAADQIANQAAKLKYMFGGDGHGSRSRSPPPVGPGCRRPPSTARASRRCSATSRASRSCTRRTPTT